MTRHDCLNLIWLPEMRGNSELGEAIFVALCLCRDGKTSEKAEDQSGSSVPCEQTENIERIRLDAIFSLSKCTCTIKKN